MAEAWPASLPQLLHLSGASLGLGDGLVEYAPDVGPSITRRGTSAVMAPLAGTMILTSAQVAIFKTFFVTTILQGSLPFTFPDPITGNPLLVKFTKQTPPSLVPQGGDNYQLGLTLMVLP